MHTAWGSTASSGWPNVTQAGTNNTPAVMLLPSMCILFETGSVSDASAPINGSAWTGTAAIVSGILYYIFPLTLVLAVIASCMSLITFIKLTTTSHECYLAAFYASALVRVLVNVVQALPIYLASWSSDLAASRSGLVLSSASSHLVGLDYWLRSACSWLLLTAAVQRTLSSLCHCGAAKSNESHLWNSRGDRLRGAVVALVVCAAAVVVELPQFWMYEPASEDDYSSRAELKGRRGCVQAGVLRRAASTLTNQFLAYDWCAVVSRLIIPYSVLPILLPPLSRSESSAHRGKNRKPSSKYHETALVKVMEKDELDFDRLLLLAVLLYLLLAAPINVMRSLTERPLLSIVELEPRLVGVVLAMADVLFNLFFPIAFVLHLLSSKAFSRTVKRMCCFTCRTCISPRRPPLDED